MLLTSPLMVDGSHFSTATSAFGSLRAGVEHHDLLIVISIRGHFVGHPIRAGWPSSVGARLSSSRSTRENGSRSTEVDTLSASASRLRERRSRGLERRASSLPTLGGSDIYRGSTNGGGVRRLTHDRGSYKPIWGPRGIAFARFEPFTLLHPRIELWQVRRDGEGLRRVSGKNLAPFGWSDDGRRLLAYGETEVRAYPFAVDPSSGNARTLIRRSTPDVSTAAISRNGRWVLAWVDGELVQIPWAGGNLRVLVRGVGESADWSR